MKNKKGFTLVELLAVIVILALIMGIAVVSIGNVLSSARENTMWENAQGVIEGVRKTLALNNVEAEGKAYGFNDTLFESGAVKLGDNNIEYATPSGTTITTGLWQLASVPTACSSTTKSYVSVDSNGIYTLCLYVSGSGNKYIFGTQSQINQRASAALKTNS